MTLKHKLAHNLIDFIDASPSPYQAARNVKAALLRKGFKQLHRGETWKLEKGGRYFTSKNASSVVAFVVGTGKVEEKGFKIIAAHTDSPTFKIKPLPEIKSEGSYLKLNVEPYGGAIWSSWFDRPLTIAGRVSLIGSNPLLLDVRYINFNKPLLVIPNLAIHLNREVNSGKTFNAQKDMLPVLRLIEENFETKAYLQNMIAEKLKVETDQILDFDLNLAEYGKGAVIGEKEEFISGGRLDDLAMVHAGIDALLNSEPGESTNVMICFDNEEVGSQTKQGAGSPFFKDVLKRITYALNTQFDAFYRAKIFSFGISADMAHAVHPNSGELHDPVTRPVLNGGPVIKINANQKYTTDGISSGAFEMLCRKAGVPVQKYVNRSDIAGGSTLGSILTSQLDIRMVDVGNPMLAMHSIRELAGVDDHYYMKNVFDEFYK